MFFFLLCHIDGSGFAVEAWWGGFPDHRQHDHFGRVENAIAEEMVVLESDAVHLPFEVRAVEVLRFFRVVVLELKKIF